MKTHSDTNWNLPFKWLCRLWAAFESYMKVKLEYFIAKKIRKQKQLDAFERLVQRIESDHIKLPFAEVNDSLKYIVDIETNRIVWVDEGLRSKIGDDKVGALCFEVLQGCTHPCDFCTNHKLLKEHEVVQWVHVNTKRLEKLLYYQNQLKK